MYDNTVFEKTKLYRDPSKYFSTAEFLLADSGYALKPFCLTPYRLPLADFEPNRIYNEIFSSARVKIEHVNGILKSRWASLKGIPTQVKQKGDFKKVNDHIIACILLHNLLIRLNDEWPDEEEQYEEGENAIFETEAASLLLETEDSAKNFRILVQNSCLMHYYARNQL